MHDSLIFGHLAAGPQAGIESMKTRTYISDIDSCRKVETFEVVLEVYQLTLLGASTNPPRRVSLYV